MKNRKWIYALLVCFFGAVLYFEFAGDTVQAQQAGCQRVIIVSCPTSQPGCPPPSCGGGSWTPTPHIKTGTQNSPAANIRTRICWEDL